MPYYVLPPALYNTITTLQNSLPATARGVFLTDFCKRLELIPHPEQSNYDTSAEFELVPTSAGIGHLDAITHWFYLGLLTDAHAGALKAAGTDEDRTKVLEVAGLFRRWLDDDYPSEREWQAITDETTNPLPENPSFSYYTAWSLGDIGSDGCTFVQTALGFAACNWYGARLRRPPYCSVTSPSIVGRVVDRGLNWIAVKLGRGPTATGDLTHYFWQASWLLDLMNLRWLPTDQTEEKQLRQILRGKESAIPEYLKRLAASQVEPPIVARTERTLKRLLDWRRRAGQ